MNKRIGIAMWLLCLGQVASVMSEDSTRKNPSSNDQQHPYLHKEEKEDPHPAEWGYEGAIGPSHWGDLSPEFIAAKTGKEQSPIDIHDLKEATLPNLSFRYQPSRIHLIYNGHTIQENEDPGSFTMADDKRFELQQFHFHSPSEHTINGKRFPMEMHLVHQADDGTVAVVAVFIREGERNSAFDPVWDSMPDSRQPKRDSEATVNASKLMPADVTYYTYDGSFTTPPCTEGVKWVVMAEPVSMSREQIDRFRAVIDGNNRPLQPLNGRVIRRSK